jgi:hypothetical protein
MVLITPFFVAIRRISPDLSGQNGSVLPKCELLKLWGQLAWPFTFKDDVTIIIKP